MLMAHHRRVAGRFLGRRETCHCLSAEYLAKDFLIELSLLENLPWVGERVDE